MDGDCGRFPAPANALVSNLDTEMLGLQVGGYDLPMTANAGTHPTNYLCCPSAAYLDYAIDELRHFAGRPILHGTLRSLIAAARPLMRASGLDRQVQPNNWLLSTNILPDLSQDDIADITRHLADQWPDRAIIWRSVNDQCTRVLKDRFEACGYYGLASRQVYLFDCRASVPPVGRDEARDLKLLQQNDYAVVRGPWTQSDFGRMAWLYQRLYLDKYTWLNPVYTPLFIERACDEGLLDLFGLRRPSGELDGFIGLLANGETVTAPLVGYDTDLQPEAGLYRRLMVIALTQAREKRLLYNMSAGAAAFKRHRGATAALEYMMIYDRHLPALRKMATAVVRAIVNRIGVPLLQRFEL